MTTVRCTCQISSPPCMYHRPSNGANLCVGVHYASKPTADRSTALSFCRLHCSSFVRSRATFRSGTCELLWIQPNVNPRSRCCCVGHNLHLAAECTKHVASAHTVAPAVLAAPRYVGCTVASSSTIAVSAWPLDPVHTYAPCITRVNSFGACDRPIGRQQRTCN